MDKGVRSNKTNKSMLGRAKRQPSVANQTGQMGPNYSRCERCSVVSSRGGGRHSEVRLDTPHLSRWSSHNSCLIARVIPMGWVTADCSGHNLNRCEMSSPVLSPRIQVTISFVM
ncbi:hypothetical protein J6590_074341 [Homalodisca vitripennis]|nr:hypothetical protein J6590_074341 [Homalodisca vitripennis]